MGAEQNIQEHYQEEGSSHAHATAIISDKSKYFIVAVLVALNLLATVMMFMKWRDAEMENRMKQYDIDYFKTHEFVELSNREAIQEKMLTSLQIEHACRKGAQ
jgi:hypothetical protein